MPSRNFPPNPDDPQGPHQPSNETRRTSSGGSPGPAQPPNPANTKGIDGTIRAGELAKVLPKWDSTDHTLEQRRELVGRLWLQGLGDRRIAAALDVSPSTIKEDIKRYRQELLLQQLPSRMESVHRTLTVHRMVQAEAWSRLAKLPDNALNAGAFLNIVLQAEAAIMRVEGTSAPDAISAAAMAEMQELMLETLRDVAGNEGMREFARRLGQRAGTSVGLAVAQTIEAEDAAYDEATTVAAEVAATSAQRSLQSTGSTLDVDDLGNDLGDDLG